MNVRKEVLLTVVVPHFGTPELLQRCVNSVPKRDDVELVVIEDSEQKGAGWARNQGLGKAAGQWITFVDADDFLPDNFEIILDKLLVADQDVLFFRNKAVMSDDITLPSKRETYQQCFNRYFNTWDDSSLRYQMCSVCGKYFSRKFIESNGIVFDETYWANDVFFSLQAGYLAERIKVFPDVAYIVTEHRGSLTSGNCKSEEEWQVRFNVLKRKYDYLSERGIEKWADEYRWLLNNLMSIDFIRFMKEMKSIRGTHYYKGTVRTIIGIRLKSFYGRIRLCLKQFCRI